MRFARLGTLFWIAFFHFPPHSKQGQIIYYAAKGYDDMAIWDVETEQKKIIDV